MIARALVHQPKLLYSRRAYCWSGCGAAPRHVEFLARAECIGTTIIMTTHYLKEAEELCNKVAVIRDGEIILNGNERRAQQIRHRS